MQGFYAMPKKELLCKEYKSNGRVFQEINGIRLNGLKKILEYSFPGYVIKVTRNNKELRFDIYLSREGIDLNEVEKFRNFYGKDFKIILLENSEQEE